MTDDPIVVRPGEVVRGRSEETGRAAALPPKGIYGTTRTERKPRCGRCGKVLAWFVTKPWKIRCDRCGLDNGS